MSQFQLSNTPVSVTNRYFTYPLAIDFDGDGDLDGFLNFNPDNNAGARIISYFAYSAANPDRVDRVRLLGNNTFGFEDLPGGGDRDYNDVIVRVDLN